jgi:hypothetical protein
MKNKFCHCVIANLKRCLYYGKNHGKLVGLKNAKYIFYYVKTPNLA